MEYTQWKEDYCDRTQILQTKKICAETFVRFIPYSKCSNWHQVCFRTLDVYLLFVILLGQIKSKINIKNKKIN